MRSRSLAYRRPEYVKKKNTDYRWDYIKSCKHDLSASICPACMLIVKATSKHFAEEYERRKNARDDSIRRRAVMRYILLECWARCQGSIQGYSLNQEFAEISVTNDTINVLGSLSERGVSNAELELNNIKKLLEKRRRVMEIGYYAAIFLQRIIRGYCSRRKFRRMMLMRFEYVYSRKGEYYIDKNDNTKWSKVPYFFRYENPGTPRTIQRRIAADQKVQKVRERYYKDHISKLSTEDFNNIWHNESINLAHLRQLVVLRDVIKLSIRLITLQQINKKLDMNLQNRKSNMINNVTSNSVNTNNNTILRSNSTINRLVTMQNKQILNNIPTVSNANNTSSISQSNESKDTKRIDLNTPPSKPTSAGTATVSGTIPPNDNTGTGSRTQSRNGKDTTQYADHPVWVSFSSPLPSTRSISISLALKTPPLDVMGSNTGYNQHNNINNNYDIIIMLLKMFFCIIFFMLKKTKILLHYKYKS